jgi:hypothetical protein
MMVNICPKKTMAETRFPAFFCHDHLVNTSRFFCGCAKQLHFSLEVKLFNSGLDTNGCCDAGNGDQVVATGMSKPWQSIILSINLMWWPTVRNQNSHDFFAAFIDNTPYSPRSKYQW